MGVCVGMLGCVGVGEFGVWEFWDVGVLGYGGVCVGMLGCVCLCCVLCCVCVCVCGCGCGCGCAREWSVKLGYYLAYWLWGLHIVKFALSMSVAVPGLCK